MGIYTAWLGQNPEGSVHVFELQPTNVSAITSSAKTPNQAKTVQISTWAATPIWVGPPLTLICTLFDKWLPGFYKGKRNNVREAWFCISCISEQLRSHYTNTTLALQELTYPTHSSLPISLLRLSDRESKLSLHTRNLGSNSALFTTGLGPELDAYLHLKLRKT